MPSATMMASRVTASAVATRAAPRVARGVAARRGAGAATGSGRCSSARQATLRVSRGSGARPLRAEQSSGKQVGSEDAVQEAASPKGEGEVLDLPSESAGETSAEPSLGDQIRELKNKGTGSDPDASDNIFAGALEEVGQVEWPTVGGALSTTAVVIGIVVGSTFVLLSVNSVLSALSQKLFG